MKASTYEPVWDLEVIYSNGSDSKELEQDLILLVTEINQFKKSIHLLGTPQSPNEIGEVASIIDQFTKLAKKIRQAGAFISCLQAQDTTDKKAGLLQGKLTSLSAQFQMAITTLEEFFASISEIVWKLLLESERLSDISFVLNEIRERSKSKLEVQQEVLIQSLSVDGYHGWSHLYDKIVAKIKIPLAENGETKELSVGQAFNKFSSADRSIRKQVFESWETAWRNESDLLTHTLNHLSGYRLNVYKARGWDDILFEPLTYNRMDKKTLETMWQVISENKQPFVDYLNRKADLLGLDQLSWYDLDAPLGKTESTVTYQEGAEFILEQFGRFGKELPSFTERAFKERWIEAEDRPNKRPGGFCTSFPESEQSRIFMTFSGTPSNVSTLAHELGHAFHQHAMRDVHPMNQRYAMNVAETASTFAEMIVADASVKFANNKEERLALIEDKLQRSVALLMNIHARFLFETAFYEERKNGLVSTERLNELMENAQKEAYCDALSDYHPEFWGSKLHFYITGVPFYNFPYTFGYLFSLGIYAKALEEGGEFETKYIALLKDTGSMKVEELAMKHLGVDLTERDFWDNAVKLAVSDVDEFLTLTEES
ncbi:M3 family oligoendopeptidase [Metabacillus arenae]|uniref:M3 family oligoendopeptidase n=1 Tax=Metabacillus arenae TaxID=2771434 RepID=A0A926NGB0_9BACI|nr:M3 family oligoendopeptidase [Metabacillus arenae]MBD1380756.1 M3 family oligoendopeptidase [Metabacillus arenae]